MIDRIDRNDNSRYRKEHVLNEICDDDWDHATQNCIDQLEKQYDGHHKDNVSRIDTADYGEKLAFNLQEDTHV